MRLGAMPNPNRLWFLRNWQAWAVLAMGVLAAVVARQAWIVTLGVIGYLLVILIDALSGGSLDPNSTIRLASAEQENRALRAEQARLIGGLKECQARYEALEAQQAQLVQDLDAARAQNRELKSSAGQKQPDLTE
jgi:hypothetical protein